MSGKTNCLSYAFIKRKVYETNRSITYLYKVEIYLPILRKRFSNNLYYNLTLNRGMFQSFDVKSSDRLCFQYFWQTLSLTEMESNELLLIVYISLVCTFLAIVWLYIVWLVTCHSWGCNEKIIKSKRPCKVTFDEQVRYIVEKHEWV